MIDYKTLKLDKNNIPVKQMYYGIVLELAMKEKESWTKPYLIEKVKKEVPLPPELSAFKNPKSENTIEYQHIDNAIRGLIHTENAIKHTDGQHYVITDVGKRAYKENGVHLTMRQVFYARIAQEKEDWEELKKEKSETNTLIRPSDRYEGYISFSKDNWKKVQTFGHKLTYDEYLDAQKNSDIIWTHNDLARLYFFNNAQGYFKGTIVKIAKEHILLDNLVISKAKENKEVRHNEGSPHSLIWLKREDFKDYHVGDCLSFTAQVYPYLQDKKRPEINYALATPKHISKIDHHHLSPKKDIMFSEGAWNTSPFSEIKPYSKIEEELEKDTYLVKVTYTAVESAEIIPGDVIDTGKEKNIKYRYRDKKSKQIAKTKVYSVYDESKKLLFKTSDYTKLREYLVNL